jgi:hypothetical protein
VNFLLCNAFGGHLLLCTEAIVVWGLGAVSMLQESMNIGSCFTGDPVDDEIEAVPFDQFDFGADVPILRLPSYMLKWARVQSGSDFIQPSDATHRSHSVLHEVFQFLANRKWSASVSSLIGRDDALFWVCLAINWPAPCITSRILVVIQISLHLHALYALLIVGPSQAGTTAWQQSR